MGYLVTEVIDSGCGISQEKLQQIGEMFKLSQRQCIRLITGQGNEFEATSGIGLGLTTCKMLLQA